MHSKALKIDVTQIHEMEVTAEPGGPGILSCRGAGGRLIDIYLSAEAMTKLECFIAKANLEQAKRHKMH